MNPPTGVAKKPLGLKLNLKKEERYDLERKAMEHSIPLEHSLSDIKVSAKNFEMVRKLGSGTQGHVFEYIYTPTKASVAIKSILVDSEDMLKTVTTEIKSNEKVRHVNALHYYGYFVTGNTINLVMEYMDLGSLANLTSFKLQEPMLSYVARQILNGLRPLHHIYKIIHRDLKPANILLNSKGLVKISDFGMSASINETRDQKTTFVGSKLYMSPERLGGMSYNLLSDIWSLGIIIFELGQGKSPYEMQRNETYLEFYERVRSNDVPTFPSTFSPELQNFLRKILKKDPAQRLRSIVLLEDTFIKKYEHLTGEDFIEYCKKQFLQK